MLCNSAAMQKTSDKEAILNAAAAAAQ